MHCDPSSHFVPEPAVEAELDHFDLRFEGHRLKNPRLERELLPRIAQEGIREPLRGVRTDSLWLLLDGFKRFRCAKILQIPKVPVMALGADEISAISALLDAPSHHHLSLLEQARFVGELQQLGLAPTDIADQLGRSKSWVSVRLGLLNDLSPCVREKLFAGLFPTYAYMSVLRPFLRKNKSADVDAFVVALSGSGLSLRQLERLAIGFFHGNDDFRQQILSGKHSFALRQLDQIPAAPSELSDAERAFLRDLDIAKRVIRKLNLKLMDPTPRSRPFLAQAHLVAGNILTQLPACHKNLQHFYDHYGQT